MNKKIFIFGILFSFLLIGCGQREVNTQEDSEIINSQQTEQVTEETTENTEVTEEVTDEENSEETLEEESKIDETEDTDDTEDLSELSDTERLDILIEESDYISHIKMSQTGSTGREVNVIEDYKGSLNSIVMPEIEGIEPNVDYLIFLRDYENGEILLTNDNGLIELTNDNEDTLQYVIDQTTEEDSQETN